MRMPIMQKKQKHHIPAPAKKDEMKAYKDK